MSNLDIYFSCGLVLGILWLIGNISGIIRYAFHCTVHRVPKPSEICTFPGIALLGDDDADWIVVAFINTMSGVLGAGLMMFLWPVAFIFVTQSIISRARKKRFG